MARWLLASVGIFGMALPAVELSLAPKRIWAVGHDAAYCNSPRNAAMQSSSCKHGGSQVLWLAAAHATTPLCICTLGEDRLT